MGCINLKIRSEKYKKFPYCTKLKRKINYEECRICEHKAYKKAKAIKGKKHRQTKATEIPKSVKEIVWERDNHRCIFCHTIVNMFYANAHFIPRSSGGLGIPENIFTACKNCHREQDNGLNTQEYDKRAKNYLKSIYGRCWTKEKLIYKKRRKLNEKQTRNIQE